jgi:flavin reductase (DIM6/NTAB) family NADH-FMN oxidoreductase RutF
MFATGVTVVSTTTPDGRLHAMTANSFTSVSLDPTLVLVCLSRPSRGLDSVLQAGVFSVNVLSEVQAGLSRRFADRRRATGAGFAGTGFTLDVHGCPQFDDSLASFACRVHAVHPGGDHAILVGEVDAFAVGDVAEPLVFHGGRYRSLADDSGPRAARGAEPHRAA